MQYSVTRDTLKKNALPSAVSQRSTICTTTVRLYLSAKLEHIRGLKL